MSDWTDNNLVPVSDSFDNDFGPTKEQNFINQNDVVTVNTAITDYNLSNDFLNYDDPLKHAYKYQIQPFNLDLGNTHYVKPHFVEGYFRQDGTYVEGFYRDGDGNPAIDRSLEQGGGYFRSDPDNNPFNNLENK